MVVVGVPQNAVICSLTSLLILFEPLSETSKEMGEEQNGDLENYDTNHRSVIGTH